MDSRLTKCRFCKPVNFLCFWGHLPVRPWKRLGLIIASILILCLFAALGWYSNPDQDLGEYIAVAFGILVGVIGLSIGAFACNKCVARVFGRI